MERLALCGGTFDPIHRGHVDVPLSIAAELQWDRIIYIPAHVQPFKRSWPVSSGFHRFAMAVLATLDDERLEVSAIELERGEVSYSVDTIEAYRRHHPEALIDWIIGDDNLALLPQWRQLDRIFEMANFVVLLRDEAVSIPPEIASRLVEEPSGRDRQGGITVAVNRSVRISATEIRQRARRGESLEELVHPRVAHYIHKLKLYEDEIDRPD